MVGIIGVLLSSPNTRTNFPYTEYNNSNNSRMKSVYAEHKKRLQQLNNHHLIHIQTHTHTNIDSLTNSHWIEIRKRTKRKAFIIRNIKGLENIRADGLLYTSFADSL